MILTVKIIPGSSKNQLVGWQNDVLRIKIHTPPEKNQANLELIDYLAKILKIPKSHISIVSGHTARLKRLEITEDESSILKKLSRTL